MSEKEVFPYLAKMTIGASANFKFGIKLPYYPFKAAKVIITSSQNLNLGGDLFNRLRVMDTLGGGEHKEQVDIDGTIVLGGVANTYFTYQTDITIQGTNLDAATCKLLIQFLAIRGGF